MRHRGLFSLISFACLTAASVATGSPAVLFESPPVHPLDMSPNRAQLYAVNTDDHRLSVFALDATGPILVAEIPVGLEPVTVRARTNTEVWVVNHLSDSISILDPSRGVVRQTLEVGDEPTDVVFTSLGQELAWVSISQEDVVRVYDAVNPGAPLAEIALSGSDPRSLAVGKNGDVVYVNVLEGGNRTTIVPENVVASSLGLPPPNPPMNPILPAAPDVSLIVKHDGLSWVDEIGRVWDFALPYAMGDHDVFELGVASLAIERTFSGVGTSMFNLAVNPVTGAVLATNQEAKNHVRFEPNLKAAFLITRLSTLDLSGSVAVVDLNPHINPAEPAGSDPERAQSMSLPLDVIVAPDGQKVYVTGFGSGKVAVVNSAGLVTARIEVGGGPCGLAMDVLRDRVYVLNRFDHSVSTVDLSTETELHRTNLGYDPKNVDLGAGRALFYNAEDASAHGDLSCASCHLFGGTDNMAWDLGDPTGAFQSPPPGQVFSAGFHPMKGPMLTQSLKSLTGTEPFHWRGDREDLAAFNRAFPSLLGRGAQLTPGDFQLFSGFLNALRYPPNPLRHLDGSLPNPPSGPNPTNGETLYFSGGLVAGGNCVDCHSLPSGENGIIIPNNVLLESQDMVVPQLRNLYEKTRFQTTGTSIRGFGFVHDGSTPDLFAFLNFPQFTFNNDDDRRDVESFLLHFDSGTHPGVGAQWTMDGSNETAGLPRLNTLTALADADVVGLIAKGRDAGGLTRGWRYDGAGAWRSDRVGEPTWTQTALLVLAAPGAELTFTGVLEGCETRLGVDRDEDGFWDRDEIDAGANPADAGSVPTTVGVGEDPAKPAHRLLGPAVPNPIGASGARFVLEVTAPGPVRVTVFDVRGAPVRVLIQEPSLGVGARTISWNARDDRGAAVPAGVYFVRANIGNGAQTQRVLVLP